MENTSDQKTNKINTINVFLGGETNYIELPSKTAGKLPTKYLVYPLRMSDIAKIEVFCNIDFVEWENKNPFNKLNVMMYALWLAVCKNKDLDYTQEQFNDMFEIVKMEDMFKLLKVVLDISGLNYKDKKEEELKKEEGTA